MESVGIAKRRQCAVHLKEDTLHDVIDVGRLAKKLLPSPTAMPEAGA